MAKTFLLSFSNVIGKDKKKHRTTRTELYLRQIIIKIKRYTEKN